MEAADPVALTEDAGPCRPCDQHEKRHEAASKEDCHPIRAALGLDHDWLFGHRRAGLVGCLDEIGSLRRSSGSLTQVIGVGGFDSCCGVSPHPHMGRCRQVLTREHEVLLHMRVDLRGADLKDARRPGCP